MNSCPRKTGRQIDSTLRKLKFSFSSGGLDKWRDKTLKKTLWPLFMDGVQLPQG